MQDLITRCPICATAFRISDTLLTSAKGMVRCGSCLNVFNASEHLQPQRATNTPPSTPRPEQTTRRGMNEGETSKTSPDHHAVIQTNPISITGFLKQQDGTSPETGATPAPGREKSTKDHSGGLFERPIAAKEMSEQDDDLDSDDDEAWALELLKDDSDLNVQFKKITEAPKTSEPPERVDVAPARPEEELKEAYAEPEESAYAEPAAPDQKPDLSPAHDEAEHHYPDDFLNDEALALPDSEQDIAHLDQHMPELPDAAANETDLNAPRPAAERQPAAEENAEPSGKVKATDEPRPARARPATRATEKPAVQSRKSSIHDAIAAIEPEPLEVDWEPTPNWKKRLLWPTLVFVALLLLAVQVAWLEFHRLSRIEPYRSLYAIACQHLNCTLPDLVDRSKIQTSNLIVRSHPEVEGALMVDVILQNNAPFEQSFPSLLLTFANLRNEPVASRRLTPDEYLGGELAGIDVMPIKQPIHIGLEIADPGSEAVSYNIAIVD